MLSWKSLCLLALTTYGLAQEQPRTTAPAPEVQALTTTFTPSGACTQNRLTQLPSPGYQIWNNEPQPFRGTKAASCYPSEFIDAYTSLPGASSSVAPLLSPLVCPSGWVTARQWENGYIACCADGYQLAPPTTTVDTDRPAYGGTCYSNFVVGTTVTVTAYDDEGSTILAPWVATSSADQAYGHPIDGFALELISDAPASTGLSGGAIAGIVVGVLLALTLVAVGAFFLLRRRHAQKLEDGTHGTHGTQELDSYNSKIHNKTSLEQSPVGSHAVSTTYSQATGFAGYEARRATIHELATESPVEMDSGWAGHELRG
ncbi:hypothetical protein B0I35DRAFT_423979 [Stachybotrys elegans]|uniref:Uncharacterized protein n=1 Tax=Stachybotrys elegans TaxID=80388 RepID=A0A8K0T2D8_9HYPO|nr:hypothetical protein B0I35DRAFT_423979 [Stachybotrys elegans]